MFAVMATSWQANFTVSYRTL